MLKYFLEGVEQQQGKEIVEQIGIIHEVVIKVIELIELQGKK
jgi:hypothetical protein